MGLLVLLILIEVVSAWGGSLALEGHLTSKLLTGNRPRLDISEDFRVEIDAQNGIWNIQDLTHTNRGAFAYKFTECVMQREQSPQSHEAPYVVSDYWKGQPVDLDEDEALLWFVYCGKRYLLENEGKAVIIPNGDVRQDFEAHSCRAYMQWRQDSDLCPSQVRFQYDSGLINNTELMSFEPAGRYLNERTEHLQQRLKIWKDSELMGELNVTRFTNVNGLGIPQSWNLLLYSKNKRVKEFDGGIDKATLVEVTVPFLLPKNAEVVDKRVHDAYGRSANINSLSYSITNGQIPQINDPYLRALVEKRENPNSYKMAPELQQPRVLFISLILLILAAPAIYFMYRKTARLLSKVKLNQ